MDELSSCSTPIRGTAAHKTPRNVAHTQRQELRRAEAWSQVPSFALQATRERRQQLPAQLSGATSSVSTCQTASKVFFVLRNVVLTFVRGWVWSFLRVQEIIISDHLFPQLVLLLIGVVLALILVTTLVTRRYSTLRVWSERKTHSSDKPRTALPSCVSSIPPSFPHTTERTHVFR